MATAAQSAASRANGARSLGPASAEGLRISSANSLKHGLRSERVAEEVENSYALEERRRTWLAQCDAQTDMDEFLITSNVVLSFNLERVWRAAAACLDREKESAGDKAIEQVQELASRLYFDPTGPTSKYGLEMVVFDKVGTSSSGGADEAYQPAKLVSQLEATAVGCAWLLHEWKLLRDRAVNGLWYSLDRLKAIRLLGCQPVDAIDQRRVAMIYVASNGLMRLGETGFEDLGSDMSDVALERLLPRVKARFRDLFFDWTEADYRQMLIDLVDENVEPLQAKLEWHKKQNARCGGDRKADELGFDNSPRGASMRQYELRCKSSLERGVARFNKLAQDRIKGGGKRVAGRDGSGAEGVATYGRGGEQSGDGDTRRARAGEWERMEQKLDAADIRACGGFLPLGRTGLASGTDAAASDVGGDGRTMVKSQTTQSVGEAVAKRSLGTRTIENPRSDCKASVSADAATADCDETLRTRRPPTAACGGTSPTGGEMGFEGGDANGGEWGEDSVSADVATADCDETLRTRRPPTAACGGTSPTGGEVGLGAEAGNGSADCGEAVRTRRPPTAACGGTSTPGGEESCTNEPELHEDVSCSQAQEIVEVTADSSGESRLDNVADLLGAGGREEDEIGGSEFDEEGRVRDEATGDDVPRLGAGQTTRSVEEAVSTRSVGTRRVENARSGGEASVSADAATADCDETLRTRRPPTAACGGTSPTGGEVGLGAEAGNGSADCGETLRTRRPPTAAVGGTSPTRGEDDELRELQAQLAIETVKRQARAGPMAEAIRDLMASSPEAMEVLKAFIPRGP